NAEGVESVVVAEHGLERGAGEEGNHTGEDTDDDRATRADEASRGSDDHEATDDTGAESEDRGLATRDPLDGGPSATSDGSSAGARHAPLGSDTVGSNGATGVEAVPAHPQHAGADHGEHEAVRSEVLLTEAFAVTDDERQDECRPARGHVHHGAASE